MPTLTPFPQTSYTETFAQPQAGDVWRVGPSNGAPPTRVVGSSTWATQSLVMIFTLNLDGSTAGLTIDGADYKVAASTLTQLVDGLNALPSFSEKVVAGPVDGDPTKIRFAWLDNAAHDVAAFDANLNTPVVSQEASGNIFLEPGMGAAYDDDNCIKRPTSASDRLFGIVLRAGLPSATEAAIRGAKEGQWPPGTMPFLERRDETGVYVPVVSAVQKHKLAYWIFSGPHAGKFRADDGGRSFIMDITLTPNATDTIGFAIDGKPAVQVESVDLATDRAALIALFNGRADLTGANGAVATVDSGKIRLTFNDRAAHTFANASTGTASTSAATYQTNIAAIAKVCEADPRITFAADADAGTNAQVEIG